MPSPTTVPAAAPGHNPGLNSFDFTLVWTADEKPLLIADPVIASYLAYVVDCKGATKTPAGFGAWLGRADLVRGRHDLFS